MVSTIPQFFSFFDSNWFACFCSQLKLMNFSLYWIIYLYKRMLFLLQFYCSLYYVRLNSYKCCKNINFFNVRHMCMKKSFLLYILIIVACPTHYWYVYANGTCSGRSFAIFHNNFFNLFFMVNSLERLVYYILSYIMKINIHVVIDY